MELGIMEFMIIGLASLGIILIIAAGIIYLAGKLKERLTEKKKRK